MARLVNFVVIFCVNFVRCVPPSPTSAVTDMLQSEIGTMKNTIKVLSDQWEKWNTLFLTSLEPRITSIASTLASIDSNIHNLQGRAHVWDTFQLHVSAWNDQLASLDRKIDIINKGQEKVLLIEGKINNVLNLEYKLDNALKILNKLYDSMANLDTSVYTKKMHDSLFNEFATRGVLSSIKMVEKKLDRLLIANQNVVMKTKGSEEKPKFTIKCNTPRMVEDLLNDISSKVDVIFDNVSGINEDDDSDYESDYIEVKDGSGDDAHYSGTKRLKKAIRKNSMPCRRTNQALEEILNRAIRIENASLILLDKENTHFERLSVERNKSCDCKIVENLRIYSSEFIRSSSRVLNSYFSEQRSQFESMLNRLNNCYNDKSTATIHESYPTSSTVIPSLSPIAITEASPVTKFFEAIDESTFTSYDTISETTTKTTTLYENNPQPTWIPIVNQNKSSCEDLVGYNVSGVYIFENNEKGDDTELFFNKRYCEIRNNGTWTVIQRRNKYNLQHNFNASWEDYKYGFGDLHRDFWIGNDFLYKTSNSHNLILRIELEDFEDNSVWAQYEYFSVASEEDNYKLTIGGYTGNASDSFSSHNGSYFSTYDRTNDLAPECCPCSVSYGGGWWFNRCFESNLNGVYHKKPHDNDYFRGIIWEHWLGNYSLKRSVMMVKLNGRKGSPEIPTTETIPYYEEP